MADWDEVINTAGNNIRSGFAEGRARDDALREQDRTLHPSTQKWLQKVMTGEMSAAEAAAAAHQEIDSTSQSQQYSAAPLQPQKLAEPGEQGQMAGILNLAPPTPQGQGILQTPPSMMPRRPEPMPYRVRDVGDLQRLAPFISANRATSGLTFEQRKELEGEVKPGAAMRVEDRKQEGRQAITDTNVDSRELIAHNKLMFEYDRLLSREDMEMEKIQATLERARLGRATQIEIAKAKVLMSEVVARINAGAKNTSSIMNDTDPAIQAVKEHDMQVRQKAMEIGRLLGVAPPAPGEPAGGPSTEQKAGVKREIDKMYKPPMDEENPAALPASKAQRVGKAQALTQAKTPTKPSGEKIYQVRFPDGSTHPVPASKLELAKKKGGTW